MTIAIYVRLSLEDGTDQESASIVNQRHLLLDFIRNDPDLYGTKVLEFSDDGYSGKNFDRPGVQALLKAALCGEVQCILVKDISRFGRDYITVGNYITRVFPFKGVRFISVNDNFDSNRKGDIDSLDRAFRALIYDLYSRDISKKVKSAKLRLAQRGVNINPVAPYGYLKAPGDKHRLIPNPQAAPIVQRIFTLVANGTSTEKVAAILNAEEIPTPSQIKVGTPSGHANWQPNYWRRATIDWIIRDRQYIGSMVYGKRVRPRIGVHQQLTAKLEDWIIVADCHEPLVTKELFARAQERLGGEQRQLSTHNKWKNPLSKKVYCGVCGYAIVRRGSKNRYYCCQTPRTVPGMVCYPEKVFESEILDVVTEAIHQQARCVVDTQHMMEQQKKSQEAAVSLLRKKVKKLEALQRELTQRIEKLYEDAVIDNLFSCDAYTAQKARLVEQRDDAHRAEAEIQAELFERTRRNLQGIQFPRDLCGCIAVSRPFKYLPDNPCNVLVRLHASVCAFAVAIRTNDTLVLAPAHLCVFGAFRFHGHIPAVRIVRLLHMRALRHLLYLMFKLYHFIFCQAFHAMRFLIKKMHFVKQRHGIRVAARRFFLLPSTFRLGLYGFSFFGKSVHSARKGVAPYR